jgi:hypothetical protein
MDKQNEDNYCGIYANIATALKDMSREMSEKLKETNKDITFPELFSAIKKLEAVIEDSMFQLYFKE